MRADVTDAGMRLSGVPILLALLLFCTSSVVHAEKWEADVGLGYQESLPFGRGASGSAHLPVMRLRAFRSLSDNAALGLDFGAPVSPLLPFGQGHLGLSISAHGPMKPDGVVAVTTLSGGWMAGFSNAGEGSHANSLEFHGPYASLEPGIEWYSRYKTDYISGTILGVNAACTLVHALYIVPDRASDWRLGLGGTLFAGLRW